VEIFGLGYCSTFVCICQLAFNHGLIKLKRFVPNCVISFFSSTFNTPCMCVNIRCDEKSSNFLETKHGPSLRGQRSIENATKPTATRGIGGEELALAVRCPVAGSRPRASRVRTAARSLVRGRAVVVREIEANQGPIALWSKTWHDRSGTYVRSIGTKRC
jgi:hypothetical protein